ncbi:unnamed protein product (macronuclear) [Paramecium tetraurelia]|uniref:Protein kinase domain-containing protein n=1 Tax=Paramecium tetraurelia TaxID=5888 RepID=A0BLU5_PARTE|nr:uncharacterized protein GSPATT00030146001 [Paramecium tetraurelia]CAK59512.1 unnamed protein product [Paramecium tetraurelia]|eukprot:XP_001426910.1 hypothetical protein (macronuclear) [Paramecium tetraurelia strain d4-2]
MQQEHFLKIEDWIFDCSVILGSGTYGKVMPCSKEGQQPNERYCAKIIPKQNIYLRDNELEKSMQNERNTFTLLEDVKCENVVKLIKKIENHEYMCLIMEQCDYDLAKEFESLKPNWYTPEQQVDMIQQIIKGACFLKDNNIIHRDIKPQNILVKIMRDRNNKVRKIYKLADFSLSRTLDNMYKKSNLTLVGTYNYYAPEIYNQAQFSSKCDIYSYGLLFHQILFKGQLPFNEKEGQMKHFEKIKNQDFKCQKLDRKHGDLMTYLVERMIVYSEERRINFEELKQHKIMSLNVVIPQTSIHIANFNRNTKTEIQNQESQILQQQQEQIYKILNIYYRKSLLCKHVVDHLKSKFQSPDQYLRTIEVLIGYIGFQQIKYAFSLILFTHAGLEKEIQHQFTTLIFFQQMIMEYLKEAQIAGKYLQMNQTIKQTYHQLEPQIKKEINELLKLNLKLTDSQRLKQEFQILDSKLKVIRELDEKNICCSILFDALNDLMNIQTDPRKNIFDQYDQELINRIGNLQKMFHIENFKIIDEDQIFNPNLF